MSKLVRFGISLNRGLLEKFDRLAKERNYTSRSEAFRDLMRQELVNRLMDIQHDFGTIIISSQHVHLDHSNCLEIIAFKGSPKQAQRLADSLRSVKGVKHGTLSMSTTGRDM
jgi:CopG family nickel-responsive transcriptional regulator